MIKWNVEGDELEVYKGQCTWKPSVRRVRSPFN